MSTGIDAARQAIRTQVWDLLERERAVEPGVHGYIPAFAGAVTAAGRLAHLPVWQAAQVIKAVPDRAQQPVRERALQDGKLLYMAVPMLADDPPFYVLDPASLTVPPHEAASRKTAARIAPKVAVADMRPVDIVVCGSVAVNRQGARLGKGAGYSDIEVALLQEAGLIGPRTVIVTTVHHLQVVDEALPETGHDFSVDLIVTPGEVIECGPAERARRPLCTCPGTAGIGETSLTGISWSSHPQLRRWRKNGRPDQKEVNFMAHVEHSSRGFERNRPDHRRDPRGTRTTADRSTDTRDTSGTRWDW